MQIREELTQCDRPCVHGAKEELTCAAHPVDEYRGPACSLLPARAGAVPYDDYVPVSDLEMSQEVRQTRNPW